MSSKKTSTKWSNEEKFIIAEFQVTERTLQTDDFKKLQAKLPDRDVNQIYDQYRKSIKKDILALYSSGSSSSAPSTPSKKRIRKEE